MQIPEISALLLFLACLAYPIILPALAGIDLLVGSFIGSLILLACPLIFLSAMNPILIAILRPSSESRDSRAGFVFSVSTAGSVAGVLATALLIAPNFSNFSAMLINAMVLSGCAMTVHTLTRNHRTQQGDGWIMPGSLTILLLCLLLSIMKQDYLDLVVRNIDRDGDRFEILSEYHSHYGNLKVVGMIASGRKEISRYFMLQEGLAQNAMDRHGQSITTYTYTLEQLINYAPHAKNALILGLGAGVVAGKLRNQGKAVTVVELNPDTFAAAKQYFNFHNDGIKLVFEDARTFIKRCAGEYDLMVLDLFHGDGMPEHMMTREAFMEMKNCLAADGVLVSNIFNGMANTTARMSLLATVHEVFGNVLFFHSQNRFAEEDKIKLTNANFVAAKSQLPPQSTLTFQTEEIGDWIKKKLVATLASEQRFNAADFAGHDIISDDNNRFGALFADMYEEYRKNVTQTVPPRLLIN